MQTLKKREVEQIGGCTYDAITDEGLLITVKGRKNGKAEQRTLPVDTIVLCAGQESFRPLFDAMYKPLSTNNTATTATTATKGPNVFMIGGAQAAGELDAKKAIDQGVRLAIQVENAKSGDVFEALHVKTTMVRVLETAQAVQAMMK